MNAFGISAQPHQRVVAQDRGDCFGEHAPDDVARGRVRGNRKWGDLRGLHGARANGPDVLGSRVRSSRSGGAQAFDEGRHDGFVAIGARDLDLDLAKSRRDAAAVTHRDFVVDDLGDPAAVGADQTDAPALRRQSGDRHQLGRPHVGTHQR